MLPTTALATTTPTRLTKMVLDLAEDGYDCDGVCLNDADGDGICDEFEIAGRTDSAAANYDPFATDDDASCPSPSASTLKRVTTPSGPKRLLPHRTALPGARRR